MVTRWRNIREIDPLKTSWHTLPPNQAITERRNRSRLPSLRFSHCRNLSSSSKEICESGPMERCLVCIWYCSSDSQIHIRKYITSSSDFYRGHPSLRAPISQTMTLGGVRLDHPMA